MRSWPNAVSVREVGPRDGLQNEPPVPVADRVRLIDALSATGLRRIEAAAFVSPAAIPPMAGAEEVMAQITRRPGVVYSALVPNVRGAQRAIEAQADEIELVVSASETHNLHNVRRTVAESLVAAHELAELAHDAAVPVEAIVSTAFGCPYEGDVAPERVAQIAGHLVDAGADRLSFGDTTGMATPRRVDELLDALAAAGIGAERVGLHFHDTRGTALANVLAALERGVTRYDASIGGLGGCPYAPGAFGKRGHRGPRAHARGPRRRHGDRPGRAHRVCTARAGDRRARVAERDVARRSAPRAGGGGARVTEEERIAAISERARAGNLAKGADKLAREGKRFVRDRLALLLDEGSFVEDGLLANALAADLPADGVVIGVGRIDDRPVCVMANDPTVKAGSWGARTVEKIVRLTEHALRHEMPVVYLVDSAGARITDQVELFPGRRGAGRIFANQVRLSGRVPQVCCLFGPSAAGGAYIPAFCDVVFMVEGNASMYLGSPRMAEMVIGERVTLEEMGGARMHASVSGCGDNLCENDEDAIDAARRFLSYLPRSWEEVPPSAEPVAPAPGASRIVDVVPEEERRAYDMHRVVEALVDDDSFFELKPLWARELIIGFARIDGEAVGIVANNPQHLGGVLFVDSADKAARFVWLCDAFNVPLLFLADVPGFMVGSQVERQGIIRHGAKMITAVAEATVPKISVIVRKAYGAGLYAMCGPAFDPDACLALPTAKIAVMGPEPAVNAVFYNTIQKIDDPIERESFVAERRAEYEADVDLVHLAAELVVDAVVLADDLRDELVARFALAAQRRHNEPPKRHGVPPV